MAAKGMSSLFDSKYEIFKIREIVNDIYFETNEELLVHFFDGFRKIAERTYKVSQTVEFLEKWKPLPGQEGLFSSVADLYESTKSKDTNQNTEVYVWSNVAVDSIPRALVGETFEHAVSNLIPRGNTEGSEFCSCVLTPNMKIQSNLTRSKNLVFSVVTLLKSGLPLEQKQGSIKMGGR